MSIKILIFIIILLAILQPSFSITTVSPTWLASNYFRAGNYQLVSVHLAPADPPAQYVFTFSPAFITTPNLGYGIKQYRGNDTFYEQQFQCTRNGGVTTTQFTVQFIILGFTQLYRLSVAYIAIDGSFPHHVRSFENIPIDYNSTLSGINSGSPATRSFTNTINYPALLVDHSYPSETFPLPLTGVKLLLFMTSAFYYHHPKNQPVDYVISYSIISDTFFSLTCTINNNVQFNKLHFSMLFFNTDEISATNKYQVKYGSLTSALSSQSFQFSDAVDQSFVMGVYSLKTSLTNCSIQYVWTKTSSSPFTVQISIPPPLGGSYAICGLTQTTSIYFYFREWSCPAPYYYFNATINLCQDLCDTGFYENVTGYTCQNCDTYLPNCLDCTNYNTCIQCPVGFNIDANNQCVADCSSLSNCQSCIIPTQCAVCTTSWALDVTNLCTVDCTTISNCLNCITLAACTGCSPGYFVDLGGSCVQDCTGNIPSCKTCAIPTICDDCYPGYIIDAGNQCQVDCSGLSNCITCTIPTECTQCDNGYIQDANNLCIINCTPYPNCVACTLTQCTQCDPFYILDANDICNVDCSGLTNCVSCFIPTQCTQCDPGYLLDANNLCQVDCSGLTNCLACTIPTQCDNCFPQYVLDGNCLCIADCSGLTNCITCVISTECSLCNPGYKLDSNNLCVIDCDLYFSYCQSCTNTTQCAQCQNGYMLNANGLCIPDCTVFLSNCLTCSNPNTCTQCSSGKILSSSHQCVSPTPQNPQQHCYNDPTLIFQLDSLNKNQSANSIQIVFKFDQATFLILQSINLNHYYQTNMSNVLKLINISIDQTLKTISYSFNYTQTIQNQFLQFQITYSHPRFNDCPLIKVFQLIASNNLPIVKFTQQDYKTKQAVEGALKAIQYLSFGVLFASMIPAKIVGIQLFGVLQLAFFSLAEQNSVNLILSPIMNMKQLNGFNTLMNSNEAKQMPDRVSSLNYKEDFMNNCNVMLFLMVAQILGSFILYGVSLLFSEVCPKTMKYAQFFLKQIFLTLILFNCFNITFSATLQLKYGNQSQDMYGLSLFLALFSIFLLITMVVMLAFASNKGFGQYKQKFKNDWPSRSYFVLTILYRSSLGVYIALMNQYQQSTLIIMSFSLFFFLYHLINLPFKDVYHNYRSTLCHLTFIVILFVSLYYRSMKSSDSIEQVALLNAPAYIEIFMILLCLIASTAMLIYEFYNFIRKKCYKNKQNKDAPQRKSSESLAKISDTSMMHNTVENLNAEKITEPQLKEVGQADFYFMEQQ